MDRRTACNGKVVFTVVKTTFPLHQVSLSTALLSIIQRRHDALLCLGVSTPVLVPASAEVTTWSHALAATNA